MTSNAIVDLARAARLASVSMQSVTDAQKNEALLRIKEVLGERKAEIFKANEQDKLVSSFNIRYMSIINSLGEKLRLLKSK